MLSPLAFETLKNRIICTDLLTLCGALPSQSVDMILCDLPYGTTACAWDSIIPLEPMWEQFKRVIKPRGAIVLTASQPFTSKLVMSAIDWFKYQWVWIKDRATGFLDANKRPLNNIEDILIFAESATQYNPQMRVGASHKRGSGPRKKTAQVYSAFEDVVNISDLYYPKRVLEYQTEKTTKHPTQKPVALFEYLIRTYTQVGELILDPCIGSGTTAIAARQTGRLFIGGDLTSEYARLATERLNKPYTPPLFLEESA